MKLFQISQDEHGGYDTYDACVVAAETPEEAQRILPGSYHSWDEPEEIYSWATKPENVTVQYLGEAAEGIKAGIILASFNAG